MCFTEKRLGFSGGFGKKAVTGKNLSRPYDQTNPRHGDRAQAEVARTGARAFAGEILRPADRDAYLGWMRRFIVFHGKRHPKEMGGPEVGRFLSHLVTKGEVSPSTQNQAFSALLFLYRDSSVAPLDDLGPIKRVQRLRKAPVVLNKEEAEQLLAQLEGVEWIMAMLLYGSGLRLLEMLRVRAKDIDFAYGQITVRDARPLSCRHLSRTPPPRRAERIG